MLDLNNIGPTVKSKESFHKFYEMTQKLPVYRTRCWHGSRMITWLPYIKNPRKKHYQHLVDSTALDIDLWADFEEEEECLATSALHPWDLSVKN